MSRPQKKYGTYTSYGSVNENKNVEVSGFQKKLNETVQLANANEEIAGDVLDEMQSQRVTLDRAHEDLTTIEVISKSARNMIQVIQDKSNRKEVTLKAVMIVLFILDFILIAIVIKNGGSLFAYH